MTEIYSCFVALLRRLSVDLDWRRLKTSLFAWFTDLCPCELPNCDLWPCCCLAARSEGKVFHFRVQRSVIGAYFVSDKLSFATLGELISYYQKNPRSLGVSLVEPCAQQVGYCLLFTPLANPCLIHRICFVWSGWPRLFKKQRNWNSHVSFLQFII